MGGATSVDGNVVDSQIRLSHYNKNCDRLRNFSSDTDYEFIIREKIFSKKNLTQRTSVNSQILSNFYTRKAKVLQSQEILLHTNSSLGLFNKTINENTNPFFGRSAKVLQQN